jgi:hypothetical protein
MLTISKIIRLLRHKYNEHLDKKLSKSLINNISKLSLGDKNVIYLFSTPRHFYHERLFIISASELANRGYPSCFLFDNGDLTPSLPRLVIDDQVINKSLKTLDYKISFETDLAISPQFEKSIRFDQKEVRIDGIEFFPVIHQSLRGLRKKYTIDYNVQDVHRVAYRLVESCELLLAYFYKLRKYAKITCKQFRICGWESDYIPNGVFATLCENVDRGKNLQYIDLNRGYMHYFGATPNSSYIAVANLTQDKLPSRLAITRNEFNRFKHDDQAFENAAQSIEKALNKDDHLNSRERIIEKNNLKHLAKDFQDRGHKVYVLYAHLFYEALDLSPAFSSMREWIITTIKFFQDRQDLLLLKPHPAEFCPDAPYKEPNEKLYDMVVPYLGAGNIKFMHPSLFNIRELAPLMSCGLVWRSSVSLELTYLRKPCIIAGNPPYRILDLCYAQSKQQYFDLIKSSDAIVITDQQVRDVVRYLYLFENEKHYHIRQLKRNGNWDGQHLKRYLKKGDWQVEALIDKLVEIS